MDLSCIISSGDLELYVLGMLPPEEAYKVEQLALLFPEVKAEIDAISASLEGMAAATAVEPSPSVKEGLMSRLAQLKREEEAGAAPVVPMAAPPGTGSGTAAPVVPMRGTWATAVAVTGLVVCLAAITYLVYINGQKNTEIARLSGSVDTLNNAYAVQQRQLQAWQQTLQMMHSPDYRRITLAAVPGKPAAAADVFWKPNTGEVFVMDVSLPPAPAGRQYQLWAIVNGQPVDAGMLGNVKMQVQKMKTFGAADAFAITLEKSGGSSTPTMSEMYVMGKAS